MGAIEINAGGWQRADGDPTKVLLKGTIYTFRAVKDPPGAPQWPSGKPTWSGSFGGGTGEEKQVTFSSTRTGALLTATCGNSRTVTLDVIAPSLDRIDYVSAGNGSQYDIYGK